MTTISRGRLVWHEGRLNVTRGSGRFVPTPPFGPLFDGLDRAPEYLVDVARYGGWRCKPCSAVRRARGGQVNPAVLFTLLAYPSHAGGVPVRRAGSTTGAHEEL